MFVLGLYITPIYFKYKYQEYTLPGMRQFDVDIPLVVFIPRITSIFVVGIGKYSIIAIGEGVTRKLTDSQVAAMILHEAGHIKHKDNLNNAITFLVLCYVCVGIMYITPISVGIPVVAFIFSLGLVVIRAIKIIQESRADIFAAKHINKYYLILALRNLKQAKKKYDFWNLYSKDRIVNLDDIK